MNEEVEAGKFAEVVDNSMMETYIHFAVQTLGIVAEARIVVEVDSSVVEVDIGTGHLDMVDYFDMCLVVDNSLEVQSCRDSAAAE